MDYVQSPDHYDQSGQATLSIVAPHWVELHQTTRRNDNPKTHDEAANPGANACATNSPDKGGRRCNSMEAQQCRNPCPLVPLELLHPPQGAPPPARLLPVFQHVTPTAWPETHTQASRANEERKTNPSGREGTPP
eukprot:g1447.t1